VLVLSDTVNSSLMLLAQFVLPVLEVWCLAGPGQHPVLASPLCKLPQTYVYTEGDVSGPLTGHGMLVEQAGRARLLLL